MGRIDLSVDLVIIGGGSAGCMAAIRAKEINPKLEVLILEKGNIYRSGCIALGMDGLNVVAIPGVTTPELYVESSTIACQKILDYKPSYVLAERSYPLLRKLENWGVNFPKDREGRYIQFQVHPKGKFLVAMDEPNLKVLLAKKVFDLGVKVLNRTMATRLLTDKQGEKVIGVTAFNLRSGDFVVCSAKAVILTCGAAGRFGLPNSGYLYGTYEYPGNVGDGYAMAFRAGAQLTGFEYTMAGPLIKDIHCPLLYIVLPRGAQVINVFGEKIEEEDGLQHALFKEIQEQKDPLFVKMNHLKEEQIATIEKVLFSTERPLQKRFFEGRGINFRRDLIELHPTEFYLCGGHGLTGLVVNERAESTLKGLFAAGDVACVPRQHLTGAFVFGEIAAENATQLAKVVEKTPLPSDQLIREEERIFLPMKKEEGEIPVDWFEYKVRRIINDYVAPPKNEYKLKEAIKWMQRFREELPFLIKINDFHELSKYLEISSIIDCAELSAVASLVRRESRWGLFHYRTDYLKRDDENWLKHLILQRDRENGEIKTFKKPVESRGDLLV